MQAKGSPPPVGVMFDTALSRSEHVLAMAVLYRLQAAREARVASLSISRPDLRTAAFCEVVARFLAGSTMRGAPAIGIPTPSKSAPSANAMAEAVLAERTPAGEPRYPHGVSKLNDTADVAALIRNAISSQQPENGVVVVTGPLSNLAATMALPDVPPLAKERVRTLAIAATAEDLRGDLAAARRVLQSWPTSIVWVEMPELVFPGTELAMRLAWAENHPVREAYQAHQKMPYDAPLASAAAVLHAARPESEWFTLSPPGVIEVLDTGATRFSASASGSHRTLKLAANQREAAVQGIIELVAAQPPAASGRGGRGGGKQE